MLSSIKEVPKVMRNIQSFILVLFFCFGFYNLSIGQGSPYAPSITLPNTPESSGLGKFGEGTVSTYTGSLNVSIPLHKIEGNSLNHDIALVYDGSGNKVANLASWVGLGWNLSAGGVITKAINGMPDLNSNYFSKANQIKPESTTPYTDQFVENNYLESVADRSIETQPDAYYFHFGGYSGKFFIDARKNIYQERLKDLSIQPTYGSEDITSFTIKDAMGNIYEFKITEITDAFIDGGEFPPITKAQYIYNSSWYLSKITSANLNESIEFQYDSLSTDFSPPINLFSNESKTYSLAATMQQPLPPSNCSTSNLCGEVAAPSVDKGGFTNQTKIKKRRYLKKIIHKNYSSIIETIEFTTSNNTYPYNFGSKKLDKITIKRGPSGTVGIIDWNFTYDGVINRLTLKSLKECVFSSSTNCKEPYTFLYNATTLPDPTSSAIDFWGYYNSNTTSALIPSITYNGVFFQGTNANRNADPIRMQAGILTRVVYPTKGYTDYEYEPHKVSNYEGGSTDQIVGGLRTKTVKNYDYSGTLLSTKAYQYIKEGSSPSGSNSSSGTLLTILNYIRLPSYRHYNWFVDPFNSCNPEGYNWLCQRITITGVNNTFLGSEDAGHVGYTRIEEIFAGKTVYHYVHSDKGDLKKIEVFDDQNKKLGQTEYTYSTDINETRNSPTFNGYIVEQKLQQDNFNTLCWNGSSYTWYHYQDLGINSCQASVYYPVKFYRNYYTVKQSWKYIAKTVETQYFFDANGLASGSNVKTTDFVYGNTSVTLPTSTTIVNSNGVIYNTIVKYPTDLNQTALIAKNILAVPLQTERYVGGALVHKTRSTFNTFNGNQLYPYQFYEAFYGTADFLRATVEKYNYDGHITQLKREYDQPDTYLWSNYSTEVSAKIRNAAENEVAFTGFETQESIQGAWTISNTSSILYNTTGSAKIGHGYYGTSGTLTKNNLPSGTYILTYYTKNTSSVFVSGVTTLSTKTSAVDNAGWYYVEKLVQNSGSSLAISVSNTYIDELRLYPSDALMITYSFDKNSRKLIATANENAVPSVFEYDGLLRLLEVRNFDRDIQQTYEYFYKNSSNLYNLAKSRTVLIPGVTSYSSALALTGSNVKRIHQYYDGLGRSLQTVGVDQSPASNDLIGFYVYDMFGRQAKKYLPYSHANTNPGDLRANPLSDLVSFYTGFYGSGEAGYAFAETVYENSPMNRSIQEKSPGSEFNAHPRKMHYAMNTASEVRNFISGGFYPANSIIKVTNTDQNGHYVIGYIDKMGQKIMEDKGGAKTYYIYNYFGNLMSMITPEGAKLGHTNSTWLYNHSSIIPKSFQYLYDTQQRLISKQIPGATTFYYYYDRLGRVVLTVDGNGFKKFTKYDIIGRPILTGKYTGTSNNPTGSESLFENKNTTGHFYTTNLSFPNSSIEIYSVFYYDSYDYDNNNVDNVSYQAPPAVVSSYYAPSAFTFVRGKITGTKIGVHKQDGTAPTQFLASYPFYDKWSRIIQSKVDNHSSGSDIIWNQYNFPGWLLRTRRQHSATISGSVKNYTINQRFTYDHAGRLANSYHQMGDNASDEKLIASHVFNEKNQLSQKKLHYTSGSNYLQTVDYSFNISGWLTDINDFTNPSDLFALKLTYGCGDENLATFLEDCENEGNWNGNVTMMEWKVKNHTNRHLYGFKYDGQNRLTTTGYADRNTGGSYINKNNYNTAYAYDDNGNITGLSRNGLLSGTSTFGQIDYLNYTYTTNGRLNQIVETASTTKGFVSTSGGTYGYDNNGNMTRDNHKDITIAYNHLNLPKKVTFDNGSWIEFTYDESGRKLSKTTSTGTVKNYLSGIEYLGNNLEAIYHPEGRLTPIGSTYRYEYNLQDHLGSNRVTFSDTNSDNVADILQECHTYPFGMEMEGTWAPQIGVENQYKYTSKELNEDFGLNWFDFGARCFDPSIGRFHAIDPLGETTPGQGVYNYVSNNPVINIDPDGRKEFRYINHWSDDLRLRSEDLQESGSDDKGDEKNEPKDFWVVYIDQDGNINFVRRAGQDGGESQDVVEIRLGEAPEKGIVLGWLTINNPYGSSKRIRDDFPGQWERDEEAIKAEIQSVILEKAASTSPAIIATDSPIEWALDGGAKLGAGFLMALITKESLKKIAAKTSRGLWTLTKEGASAIKNHKTFGTIYKSSSDGLWWAVDKVGHGGSKFKVFKETNKGLEWFKDADEFGDFIINKHKGSTGTFIPWGQLSTVK